jgi:hypothetical protein
MILQIMYEECKRRKNNLSSAWINYQKAYDGIPHNWVEKPIELVRVNSKTVRLCKSSTKKWNKRLQLKTKQEVMQSQPIQIQRGILQRDSHSPLHCCTVLTPVDTLR